MPISKEIKQRQLKDLNFHLNHQRDQLQVLIIQENPSYGIVGRNKKVIKLCKKIVDTENAIATVSTLETTN